MCDLSKISYYVLLRIKEEFWRRNVVVPKDVLLLAAWKLLSMHADLKEEDVICGLLVFFEKIDASWISTLEMQVLFATTRVEKECLLESRRNSLEEILSPIYEDITTSHDSPENIYDKISRCSMLRSGCGDPSDSKDVNQTTVALKSVFSRKEMGKFAVSKDEEWKRRRLLDLCDLVAGIKLYNREMMMKTDEDHLPILLQKAACKSHDRFVKCLEDSTRQSEALASFMMDVSRFSRRIKGISIGGLDEEGVKRFVVFKRQFEAYLEVLLKDNLEVMEDLKDILSKYEVALKRITEMVKFRPAVPTLEIYPKFKEIALCWSEMREMTTRLNKTLDLFFNLQAIVSKVPAPKLATLFKDKSLDDGDDGMDFTNMGNCKFIFPNKLNQDYYAKNIKFSGFCVVTFVDFKGVLVKGNAKFGAVKHGRNYYIFSKGEYAGKFCTQPQSYLEKGIALARLWPETILLLELREDFWTKCEDKQKWSETKVKDAQIQTELHPKNPDKKKSVSVQTDWRMIPK